MSKRYVHLRFKPTASAKHGAAQWYMERVTSLALVPLVLLLVASFLCATGSDGGAKEMFSSPLGAVLGVLCFGTAFYHSFLGMKVVIEDYVHHPLWNPVLINAVRMLNVALGVGATTAIWLMAAAEQQSKGVFSALLQ
jgi:succinate dehydrogenase / fumarate reductase membrane anchor subunit